MTWLKWLWDNRKLVAALIALGLVGYLIWLAKSRGQERDELQEQVSGYEQVVSDMHQWHDAMVTEFERKVEQDGERSEFERIAAVERAKDSANDVTPLPAVLSNGLDRLRARQAQHKSQNP